MSRAQRPPRVCQYCPGEMQSYRALKFTFVGGAGHASHDCCPVHEFIIGYRAEVLEDFVGLVVVGL
jgi:hypothetical protein